jgi:MFS family permease
VKRDYALIIASTFVAFWVNGMLYPVVPIYIKHLSGDDLLVGLSFALPFFVQIPMSFLWGTLSDYLGKRRNVIIYSGLAASFIFFLLPNLNVIVLILARTMQLFFFSSSILTFALVTEYFPKEKGRSIGDLHLFGGAGSTVGGLVVGLLISSSFLFAGSERLTSFFYICGFLSILSMVFLFTVREVEKDRVRKNLRDILKFGDLGDVGRDIRNVCMAVGIVHISLLMVYSAFPVYVEETVLGSSDDATSVLGILSALASLGGLIGSGLAGRICDKYGRRSVFISSILLYIVFVVIYGTTRNLYVIGILWSIPLYSFLFVSATAMISDLTSDEERGRGMGLLNSTLGIGAGMGALMAGYAARLIDFQTIFLVSAIFIVMGLIISFSIKETIRK